MLPSHIPGAPPLGGLAAPLAVGGAPLYLTGEDVLKVTVFNAAAGVTVKVSGRFQSADGGRPSPFVSTLVPATDRTASTLIVPLAEGWLLNAQAIVSGGAPLTGQTFAILSLARGVTTNAEDLFTLVAGTITAKQRLSYPGSAVANTLDGGGALRSIAGATPGAGAEISETVPTGARWELLTFQATLVTSAAAANRVPQLTIDDGTTVIFRVGAALNQAASLTQRRSWFQGAPAPYLDNASNVPMPLPSNVRLGAAFRIKTVTAAIDVADQYSAVQYLVREWIEGA